jgi:hypothetical protein
MRELIRRGVKDGCTGNQEERERGRDIRKREN